MKKKSSIIISILCIAISSAAFLLQSFKKPDNIKGLKDYYKKFFPIGVAVRPQDFKGEEAKLILSQFNSITAENVMKMGPIHPVENKFYWKDADAVVDFAQQNKLKVRGHALCWHAQTPRWLYTDQEGKTVSKEVLLKRLENHIDSVVTRYKGKIYAYDVVNEAVDDGPNVYRKSKLYEIAGEDFIAKSFEYAHKADPKAVLFYNDYNTEIPAKREKIYNMLKDLLARGVPIHGVGLQAHWSINSPSREELEKSIEMFSSLGLQIQFTELDVSVYAGRQGGQLSNGTRKIEEAEFTAEMEQKQLEKYQMIFEVFRKYKKNITGVTFWNLSDKYSWLDGRGRKNYPLLFDKELKPKKAFSAVTNF